MLDSPAARALGRWIAATGVGIALVVGLLWAVRGGAALWLVVLPVALAPCWLSRRHPNAGAWLAAALLAASPFALVMVRWRLDTLLVASYWRCGTGDALFWLGTVPIAQAMMALAAGALWRGRRRLARLWRPSTHVVVGLCVALLALSTARTLALPVATDAQSMLSKAESTQLPAVPADGTYVDVAAGVEIERSCEAGACEPRLAGDRSEPSDAFLDGSPWPAEAPVTVYALGDVRVIEAVPAAPHTGLSRVAYDLRTQRVIDLHVSDVAQVFGPGPAPVLLALLGLLATLASSMRGSLAPQVWRRLGAYDADARADGIDEVIALRMTHLAILVVTALPLFASAWIGLVF